MSIQLTMTLSGLGPRVVTGQADAAGMKVSVENEASCFVSWAAFRQLLSLAAQIGSLDRNPLGCRPQAPPHQQ